MVKNTLTFVATIQANGNRIVIPKKKLAALKLKPGDDLKVTIEKIN